MNPFGDLTLSPEDRANLVNIVNTRANQFKTSGEATMYLERKKNSDWNLPELLMVGPHPGTLDEIMFGLVNPTLESMRIKASYLNDFSAAAVLATIVEPTADKPFNAVVVKWMEIDIPGAALGIVRNRDYVSVESTGILPLKNGDRVGYHILHSINFPETHELPNKVRGNMSLSAIFHQVGPDRTDCRDAGIMDPKGDMIGMMAVAGMVQAAMAGLNYSYCGQMKKLTWLLEQKQVGQSGRNAPVVKPVCVTCSKPIRSSKLRELRKSSTTCKLCFGTLCGSCKLSKKLSFISLDLELTQRKVAFCHRCLIEANRLDTLEAARHQFVYKQRVQPVAYASLSVSSRSDGTTSDS